MSSGVSVDPECLKAYRSIQLKKTNRYVIFRLSDDMRNIIVDKLGEKEETYEDFLKELQAAEGNGQCRYAIFDMPVTIRCQGDARLVFISWVPDGALIKQKMVYAASKGAFKKELGRGIHLDIQANEFEDLNEHKIKAEFEKE